ncbi:zinc ribbon domain-containing protein [Streptomyces lydicamycinicus]|uniref:RNA-guided endonuclease InsQ/TnpB family protein n=1 Tax=Streptomyces lydicamycinicus TaxID=1546107 RepID=UPI002035D354|nr:zinc ribbon domain-containing protein [Streptomyces lydicamycinicus]USA03023.1 zinc ribbon domain-containing protein [Streptomyces lydicamycinicus]
MAMEAKAAGGGHARFAYRLRVSSTACAALEAEWDRCRWLWNECVAKSKQVGAWNKTRPEGAEKQTCGPVQLAAMLTEARARIPWLREGACVPQQQLIRDFGRSRAKALKDIRARLPMRQRAGMPKYKKKREALLTLEYTKRGFRLKDGRLHLAGGTVVRVVWSRDLPKPPSSVRVYRDSTGAWYASFVVPTVPEDLPATGPVIGIDWGVTVLAKSSMARKAADAAIGATKAALAEMARKHGRAVHLVHPAHTTMDCAQCGARTKHALPLSERTYACTACGAVSPRDKNSARVMSPSYRWEVPPGPGWSSPRLVLIV